MNDGGRRGGDEGEQPRTSPPSPAVVLSVAGSDSGGGAGIQADLKTFHRFGVFGTTAVTAVTAQNTRGVTAWVAVAPAMVRAQIDAIVSDLRPAALKSGMLADAAIVGAVADAIGAHGLAPYVLDPVMVATSGYPLLAHDATGLLARRLLPLAALVTPNLDEAAALVGHPVDTPADMERAARALVDRLGAGAALVKGGHLGGPETVDVLYDGAEVRAFHHPRLVPASTHGTGCTLSAAITAMLALGHPLVTAVERSLEYVHRAIATAPRLGGGNGPLNHFA